MCVLESSITIVGLLSDMRDSREWATTNRRAEARNTSQPRALGMEAMGGRPWTENTAFTYILCPCRAASGDLAECVLQADAVSRSWIVVVLLVLRFGCSHMYCLRSPSVERHGGSRWQEEAAPLV